ncbi:MAG: hypothetical protein CMB42_02190 [Euryarchaeota archaeon]|nr:hypothetical protein [Euryarchaeota archaeon]MBL20663.1 hypothetical protein [Euryarchaeota archaeon]|tara:strand:+ start:214 stop:894 length:681 start_codon:yes stop_codon:yes gene_type:complete
MDRQPTGNDVPVTWWSSDDAFSLKPRAATLAMLVTGLFLFGLGDAVIISADWGVAPWTVLADGVSIFLNLSIGAATFLVSLGVLLLWIPLRELPGIGTVLNIVIIAGTIELSGPYLGTALTIHESVVRVIVGTILIAVGSALYLTCNLGPGPRDGWMTGLHKASGKPIGLVRGVIEISVLLTGWALGGDLWAGTVVFAVLIGPAVAVCLKVTASVASNDRAEVNPD